MELTRSLTSSKILKTILIVFIGSIVLTISAKINVPFYPVPMTMQTFVVIFIGMAFGWKLGLATVFAYLVEGAFGLPVFAGTPEKGIGISYKEPLYVVNINALENKIIVGNREALSIKKIYLKDLNLLSDVKKYNDNLFIKARSTGQLIKAK